MTEIEKDHLLEVLAHIHKNKYGLYPEGEVGEEAYKSRVMRSEGFLECMKEVKSLLIGSGKDTAKIPDDVLFAWGIKASCGGVGLETYQKLEDTIMRYPEYFPWERKHASIPKEVHNAYHAEKYPDGAITITKGMGILELIECSKEEDAEPKKPSVWSREYIDEFFEALEEPYKKYVADKALWDKHYAKFGLEYKGR